MTTNNPKSDRAKEPGSKKTAAVAKAEAVKAALAILGINQRQLEREPKFSQILADKSLGGLAQVMEAMRLSSEPQIVKFIDEHDRLNKTYRKIVPWEAIALKAGINGRELLGAIILALRSHSAAEVKITALTSHAKVTEATVSYALLPDGSRERLMIHQALGFLQPPKGQTINVSFPGEAIHEGPENREIAAEDIDMNEMFPDLTTTQRKMLPE